VEGVIDRLLALAAGEQVPTVADQTVGA